MSEQLFSILLCVAGIFGAISQTFVSYTCFALIAQTLNRNEVNPSAISFKHLVGYSIATLLSGCYFTGMILLAVHWANNYPEWADRKKLFWIGFIGGLIISRLFGSWRSRGK